MVKLFKYSYIMKVVRRFPNFIEDYDNDKTEHEVNSKEELLNIFA